MGFKFLDLVFKQTNLRGAARLVMLALADYADKDGVAFPSIPTLSRKAGLSGRHTQRVIRDLTRRGDLAVEEGRGPHRTNRYRVTVCQGDSLSGMTCDASKGDIPSREKATPVSPKPSDGTLKEPSGHRQREEPWNESAWTRFWAAYPKKVAEQPAIKAWNTLKPSDELARLMLQRLECQKRTPQWRKDSGMYVPNPAKWLTERRWEDEEPSPGDTEDSRRLSSDACNWHANGLRCQLRKHFRMGPHIRCRWHHYIDQQHGRIHGTFEEFCDWLCTRKPFNTEHTAAELWAMANWEPSNSQ